MFVRQSWLPQSQQGPYYTTSLCKTPEDCWSQMECRGPDATNLPFVLDASRGEKGVLTSHLARANAQALALQKLTEPALAVFHGPSSYVTASWYPGRDMPPTVYYSAVHCFGPLVFQDQDQLRDAVETLTARNEQGVPDGWKTSEIPNEAIVRRLPAILGFEVRRSSDWRRSSSWDRMSRSGMRWPWRRRLFCSRRTRRTRLLGAMCV